MPRRKTYKQSEDGDWQYPTMREASFVSCCDCGLVHKNIIEITPDNFAVRDSKGKWRYGRRVRIKVSRDYRKTAQVRRGKSRRKELYVTRDGWYVAAFPINVSKRRKSK
jgi:hypothetical protein